MPLYETSTVFNNMINSDFIEKRMMGESHGSVLRGLLHMISHLLTVVTTKYKRLSLLMLTFKKVPLFGSVQVMLFLKVKIKKRDFTK